MTARALGFGAAAAAYERYRPGYPDALVDEVLAYAGRPVRTALEVGAGTGKATRAFARRGIAVTATDPDPAMLAELGRHVPSTVRVVEAAFEELPLDGQHDLVLAAASLHWTAPGQRWERVRALLADGGVLASFGGPVELADRDLGERVRAARAHLLATDDVPSPDGTPPGEALQWPGTELETSVLFGDVRQRTIGRRLHLAAEDYVGYLSTVSAYLALPPRERREALDLVRGVLPEHVEVVADLTLHLARAR